MKRDQLSSSLSAALAAAGVLALLGLAAPSASAQTSATPPFEESAYLWNQSYDTIYSQGSGRLRTLRAGGFLPEQAGVVGLTSVSWVGTTLKKAAMTLATGEATPEQVQSVASHEFGHALGIEGHSDDPNDLMFPTETRYYEDGTAVPAPTRSITGRDVQTLKACYPCLFGRP